MRRAVVTPTFAAGLGVVVAAFLAYPVQTVFDYAAPGGSPCKVVSCGPGPQTGGEPASVPGDRIKTSARSAGHHAGQASAAGTRSGPSAGHGGTPYLSYWTFDHGSWGFGGTIVITFPSGAAQGSWRLVFGYPSARIVKVWAGRFISHGRHTAVVTSSDWRGQAPGAGPLGVWFRVTGHPAPPRDCSFNGQPCHVTEGHQRWPGSRGGPGSDEGSPGAHEG
jgi:hypothetical protein